MKTGIVMIRAFKDPLNWLKISKKFDELSNRYKLEGIVSQIIEDRLMIDYPDNYETVRVEYKEQLEKIKEDLICKYSQEFKQKSEKYLSRAMGE